MKYEIHHTSRYKRDFRLTLKRGYNVKLLDEVVLHLANGIPLSPKHRDHALSGNWAGYRECHITPDWLLIYTIRENVLILVLAGTGTHSDLF